MHGYHALYRYIHIMYIIIYYIYRMFKFLNIHTCCLYNITAIYIYREGNSWASVGELIIGFGFQGLWVVPVQLSSNEALGAGFGHGVF